MSDFYMHKLKNLWRVRMDPGPPGGIVCPWNAARKEVADRGCCLRDRTTGIVQPYPTFYPLPEIEQIQTMVGILSA